MKLNDRVRYTMPKSKRVVEGVVVETDTIPRSMLDSRSGKIVSSTRYKIKPEKGRSVWTVRFADPAQDQ